MRWIVGDVHGCAIELDRLVRAIRFDASRDELWSVGDLVNTGPDSLETLRLWGDLGGRSVLGNHDIHALRRQAGTRERRPQDTLDELLAASDAPALLERLGAEPVLARLRGEGRVREVWLVHAGLHPQWSDPSEVARRLAAAPRDEAWLTSAPVSFATRVRCCTAAGEMSPDPGPPQHCRPPHAPWDRHYRGDALVVHGHWAQRGLYRGRATLGLDSGCVYGGELTAWCPEEDRLVHVAARGAPGLSQGGRR